MTTVVLGATGGTGRQLVAQALARGREVRALVRDPDTADLATHPRLTLARVDVFDADSVIAAIDRTDTVLSGLGVTSKTEKGTLTAGAAAVTSAHPSRIVWLGAAGTGPSAATANSGIAWMLRKGFGNEYDDKMAGEQGVLAAGGAVLHSGPFSDKPDDPRVTLAPLAAATRRFFPRGGPRASIARLMLDLADDPSRGVFLVQRA